MVPQRLHFLAVRDMRVVLYVLITRVLLDGLTRLTLIEHQVIERLRVALVLLQVVAQFHFSELLRTGFIAVRLQPAIFIIPMLQCFTRNHSGISCDS